MAASHKGHPAAIARNYSLEHLEVDPTWNGELYDYQSESNGLVLLHRVCTRSYNVQPPRRRGPNSCEGHHREVVPRHEGRKYAMIYFLWLHIYF